MTTFARSPFIDVFQSYATAGARTERRNRYRELTILFLNVLDMRAAVFLPIMVRIGEVMRLNYIEKFVI